MPTPATRYRSDDLTGGYTADDTPAIFWSPHADDETISYGVQACNHAGDGRNVLIVLNTQGASTGMLDILNGALVDNSQAGVRHDPVLEHYRPDYLLDGQLTSDTAGRSRWDEFSSAVGAMNRAYPGRVRAVTLGLEEGSSVAVITQEVRDMIARFPGADHKGYSYLDTNPDHAAVGAALRTLGTQDAFGVGHPPRFAVAPDERLQIARDAGLDVHTVQPMTPLVLDTVHRAALAYGGWNPVAGAFGFGKKSSKLVTEAETATVGYEHY